MYPGACVMRVPPVEVDHFGPTSATTSARGPLDGFRGGTPSSSPWAYFASDAINSTKEHLIRLTGNNFVQLSDAWRRQRRPSRRSRAQWARVVGKPQRKTLTNIPTVLLQGDPADAGEA